MMRMRVWLTLLMLLAAGGCRQAAGPYPAREIKLVVQAGPGGLSDTVSRVMASLMEPSLGVPVVCENRPGGSGALAFSYVSRRPPDGYTIGHAPVEIAMVRTLGYADVGPDQMDLLCLVSKTQPVLVVHPESPWRTLRDFVEAARGKPGHYVLGNSGTGSIWHVNALLLERSADLSLVHLPFSGSGATLTSLMGRHVDAVVAGAGEASPHVASGRLRVISVFGASGSRLFPGVAASAAEGFDFGADAWSGFFAPRGIPAAAREALTAAMREAFSHETFQRLCEERGMEPVFLESEAFHAFAQDEAGRFAMDIPRLLRMRR